MTNRIIWSALGKVTWFLIWTAAEKTPQRRRTTWTLWLNGNTFFLDIWESWPYYLYLFIVLSIFGYLFLPVKFGRYLIIFFAFITCACHSYPVRDNSPSYSAIILCLSQAQICSLKSLPSGSKMLSEDCLKILFQSSYPCILEKSLQA